MDGGSVESVLALPYRPVWLKVLSPQRRPVLLRQLVAETRARYGADLPPSAALCFRGGCCSAAGWFVVALWGRHGQHVQVHVADGQLLGSGCMLLRSFGLQPCGALACVCLE